MSHNVIILNESPRPKGNTSALVAEFVREAETVVFATPLYYQTFSKIAECDKILDQTEIGHVLAGGVMKVGDIKNHSELDAAYRLGKSLAKN